jgi:hypothetical protein
MNARSHNLGWPLAATMCFFAALAPAAARGEGSITFNATDSIIENVTADVLEGSDTMTITAWVKATGPGESGFGQVVVLDPAGDIRLQHHDQGGSYGFVAEWTDEGQWTFSALDTSWRCLQVTYDKSSTAHDPDIYVDGIQYNETRVTAPQGSSPAIAPGYWVGNIQQQSLTWQGQIAHVQLHNRILSKAELDACRQAPGSVLKGLRVWLPMPNASDTKDRSGNGLHGTAGGTVTTGADGPVLTLLSDKLSGVRILPAGITAIAQHLIPRYANGTDHPSGELRGWGAKSVISADANTQNLPTMPVDMRAVVITEGYDEDISEWQAGSSDAEDPAVLQPVLANCTIQGYNPNGWTTDGDVNDQPWVYNTTSPTKYHGFLGYAGGGTVENITIFGIPGIALDVKRRGSTRLGKILQHDRLKWNVGPLNIKRVYAGAWLRATDMFAHDIEVEAFRDWGVRMGSAVQFGRIHAYGGGYDQALGGGAAIWIEGEQCQGGPIYPENARIGLRVEGNHAQVNGITSHTCGLHNLMLNGQAACINNIDLRRAPTNVLFAGDQNMVSAGKIQLAEAGIGVKFVDGTPTDSATNLNHVRDVVIDGYGDKDGDGDVDVTNRGDGSGYDEQDSDNGIGIDVDTTLNNCTIHAFVGNCSTGIDFSGGAIGNTANVIWINTDGVSNDVIWPNNQTWTTTFNPNETCDVRINGVRHYRP